MVLRDMYLSAALRSREQRMRVKGNRHNKDIDNLSAVCYTDVADRLSIYYRDHIPHIRNKAVKVSTGEPPASNYLRADLIGDLVRSVNGTIVECNTAYAYGMDTSEKVLAGFLKDQPRGSYLVSDKTTSRRSNRQTRF